MNKSRSQYLNNDWEDETMKKMTVAELANMIDHTLLKPYAEAQDFVKSSARGGQGIWL